MYKQYKDAYFPLWLWTKDLSHSRSKFRGLQVGVLEMLRSTVTVNTNHATNLCVVVLCGMCIYQKCYL